MPLEILRTEELFWVPNKFISEIGEHFIRPVRAIDYARLRAADSEQGLVFMRNPAPDGHRCGVCPTYLQKICGFDFDTNATFIFDNHCVMDLYNCIHGTEFINQHYETCLFFGNFAYVHGYKYEDYDYGEDHIVIRDTKKNPDFVK